MPEEPEQMLVEDWPALSREELRPKLAVELDQDHRGRKRRAHHEKQDRGRDLRPDEQWQTGQLHARRAQGNDGGQEVGRGHDAADGPDDDAHRPEVDAQALGLVRLLGQRRIARPACIQRATREEAAVVQDDRHRHEPEPEQVDAREGHVARPDHDRHHVVRDAGQEDGDEEEDHRHAVRRDDLVVGLRVDDLQVRLRQLEADDQREDPPDHEAEDACDHVHDPDQLVVGRRQPKADGLPKGVVVGLGARQNVGRRHQPILPRRSENLKLMACSSQPPSAAESRHRTWARPSIGR